ncbi:MAG: hypothetical protein OEM22_00890 [Acidimicrobiia bacterium]|nr:hypothetical protein [Acidimicrobiia bacterium]MDH3470229.1 hypothetical protein [Acidimicrobiia bacterium]
MRIGYQGEPHSYSSMAAAEIFADDEAVGFRSFVGCFEALENGAVDRLVLPVSNSITGPIEEVVAGISELEKVGETTVAIGHALLVLPGADLSKIARVKSHSVALGQAANYLAERGWASVVTTDTAGAAREVVEEGDPTTAALASPRAAAYGLEIAETSVADEAGNQTVFVAVKLRD